MSKTRTLSAQEILDTLDRHADSLRELGALRIGLLGSIVRGDARPDSDIDLLVTLSDNRFDTYCNVLFFLEDLFNSKIDLVPEDDLKPRIRSRILSEVRYAEGPSPVGDISLFHSGSSTGRI